MTARGGRRAGGAPGESGSRPAGAGARPDGVRDEAGASLASLFRASGRLQRRAEALDALIAAELAELDAQREGPPDAQAPWADLAEEVLPLSAKHPGAGPAERRLAGLDRQRVRLNREGSALAEAGNALRSQGHDLARAEGTDEWPVRAWRAQLVAWADEALAHQRRTARWAAALADYRRRRARGGT
jgi:hypothetical protein